MRSALILFCGLAAASCYNPDFDNDTPFKCSAQYTVCPDGFTCNQTTWLCTRDSGGTDGTNGGGSALSISKTGSYMGTQVAPGMPPCKDMEDHSSFSKAFDFNKTGRLKDWQICPAGNTDLYKFVVPDNTCARVSLYYSINKGDLDLAIYDSNQKATSYVDSDFNHDNACVVVPVSGTYYALVAGAYNHDVNDYEIQIDQEAATNGACPTDFNCSQITNGTP